MTRSPVSKSIRVRLTLWYAAVLAAILLVYAGGAYFFLRTNLYADLDRRLADDVVGVAALLTATERAAPVSAPGEAGFEDQRWLEVLSPEGELLYQEGTSALALPPSAQESRDGASGRAESIEVGVGSVVRMRTASSSVGGSTVLVRAARSEALVRHELRELLVGMGLGLPAAVLVACLGGYFLAGRALRPVGQMAERASAITAESLGQRLPIENAHDELGRLGSVLNDTLARLEGSFETMRRFTADAAHELRTPLTALRSVGEVTLRESRSGEAYREAVGSMLEEVDRLTRLVDTLLTLSHSDSGRVEIRAESIELRSFAEQAKNYLEVLADEKQQSIVVDGSAEAWIEADPRLLHQAISNILDNAIKYSPVGSCIRVEIHSDSDIAGIDVVDQGPGIAAEHIQRVFERFYRVDGARSRQTGGAGLGLSIARWAIQANGGTVGIDSKLGEGTRFVVRLPLAEGTKGDSVGDRVRDRLSPGPA
ncbi:MAG: heavy metal sensor histidine kinase [Longimicrobiales bacterium]